MEDPSEFELNELSAEGQAPPPSDAESAAVAEEKQLADTPDRDPGQGQDQNDDDRGPRCAADLEAVYEVPVQVSAVLGKATLQVSQLLKLGRGAVVELDRKVGEAIDIYINDRLVARGEVVVVEDRLGVTMTEIIKSDHR